MLLTIQLLVVMATIAMYPGLALVGNDELCDND